MQGQVWRLAVENHPDQIQRCLDLLLTRDNTPGSLDRQLETLAQYLAYPSTWTAAYAKGMSALLNAASRTVRGKKSLLWYLWPVAMDGALAIEKDGGLLRWLIETHDMATASVCGKRGRGMNGFHLPVLGSHHLAEYRGPDSLDAGRVAWICDQLLSGGGEPKGPMVYLDNECQEGFSSPLALACRFYEEGDLDGMIVDALITAGADWMALAMAKRGMSAWIAFLHTRGSRPKRYKRIFIPKPGPALAGPPDLDLRTNPGRQALLG